MSPNETPNDVIREVAGDRRGTSSSFVTLRDHFAAQALVECIRIADAQTDGQSPLLSGLFKKAALYAYFAADSMLAAREQTK